MIYHVWSFDPGETTGWCHLSVHSDEQGECEVGLFNCGEADHLQVGNMLYDNPALKAAIGKQELEIDFVAERFVMNSKITQSPWSLETIGLIRYFAKIYHIPFHLQAPSQAKNLIKNTVLKKADLYVPGQGHAMDAARHAVYFLVTKRGVLKECLR